MLYPFSHVLFRSPLQNLHNVDKKDANPIAIFQEGLYLSSPEFYHEYQRKEQLKDKEREKLELSFNKYYLRSCVRCTPYGTFAGSSLANISSQETNIVLESNAVHNRKLRLDMNYMAEIVTALIQMPAIRKQILFMTNNSIYQASDVYRYAEYYIRNNTRNYQLTAVNKTPYLTRIVKQAEQGVTMTELAQILVESENVTKGEAEEYVIDLWLSQLLIPALDPTVTGGEPLGQVISQLEKLQGVDEMLSKLKEIQYLLNHPKEGVAYYQEIERKLEQLELGIKVPKNTIQVDLFLETKVAEVNKDLVQELVSQVSDLKAFARQSQNLELDEFKTKYYARYEDKSMPLSIVLDADLGIGYAGVSDQSAGAGEWIDGLAVRGGASANPGTSLDYLQQYSLMKYQNWLAESKEYIEVSEDDIKIFRESNKRFKFPNSMYLMGSLMKRNNQLDARQFIFDISSLGGPSAANLLGRFVHGNTAIEALTKNILAKEELEHPDAVYAEVAHLPQARIGNILLRPVLRKYEIPYVGLSGIERENQITIDDLMVSVQNNEIILFSKKLNRRVIPRLTTAHNFGYNSLPIYKFLCDLQRQGVAYANVWDWGHLAVLKHLPRVVYKNLIIQKAIWKIEEKEISDMPNEQGAYKCYFETFCTKLKMPARVVYKEGDNELLIDFLQETGIALFLHYLRRYKNILLEEFLFTEENCVVHDMKGNSFTNEMIIPLYDNETTEPPHAIESHHFAEWHHELSEEKHHDSSVAEPVKIQRSFSPYSEWLYFKVYCGAKSAEKILATIIHPFIEIGLEEVLFEQFFFIRYYDESGGHFRIRFKNRIVENQLRVYQKFVQTIQPLVDTGTIQKVMLDTYNRELERYIPQLIEEAEALFYHDSIAILRFINLLDGLDSEQYRMLFALRGIDMLLSDFHLSLEQKAALVKNLQKGFFKEFGAHSALQKQLNDRYRKHQHFFASHFNPEKDEEHEIEEAVSIFMLRSEMNKPVVEKIDNHLKQSQNPERIFDLLGSYIHMYMNRLYLAQQRKYELVVYHFLDRYYSSRLAIERKAANA